MRTNLAPGPNIRAKKSISPRIERSRKNKTKKDEKKKTEKPTCASAAAAAAAFANERTQYPALLLVLPPPFAPPPFAPPAPFAPPLAELALVCAGLALEVKAAFDAKPLLLYPP
jgi:hypothetical protein